MFDVVVVGGGVAGLRAAVEARRLGKQTALVTKTHPLHSFSISLQDGLNAALGPGDSWEEHARDTLWSGGYLADQDVVEGVCQEASQVVQELDTMGMPFHRDTTGGFALAKLMGSSNPRTVSVHDMTGHALMQVLYEQALKEGVQFYEDRYAASLVVEDERCCGVVVVELASGKMELLSARALVLATGGVRRLYEPSTGSLLCTGDGISLAYRAGAALVDMEMVQYHPCVIKNGRLAISELLLAGGAEVTNSDGKPITITENGSQPWGSALAQAIAEEIAGGRGADGHVLLKTGVSAEAATSTYYTTGARLKMFLKTDLSKDAIPVLPAMHRLLGGIAIDAQGATTLPGLFAAGECAGAGFHGAGALDGNGLMASTVFGRRAGQSAAELAGSAQGTEPSGAALADQEQARQALLDRDGSGSAASIRGQLAETMHQRVGLQRDASGLEEASRVVGSLREAYRGLGIRNRSLDYNNELLHYYEVGFLLDTAEAIIASAQARQESRGVHMRKDFPKRDDDGWLKHLSVQRSDAGPQLGERPVQVTKWPVKAET